MTTLTMTTPLALDSVFDKARTKFRSEFSMGIKPVDGRQPIPDELARDMVQELIDCELPKDALIGVIDAFLILSTHLKEAGFTNLVLLENTHQDLTKPQQKYYNNIRTLCDKSGIKYYVPPMNNYSRCNMKFGPIIGNPPYQSDTKVKNWVMWHQFLEMALDHSDFVSYVIPASITSPGKMWNLIRNNLKKIDFTVGDHFKGVGSTFCRIVVDKKYSGDTEVVTESEKFNLNVSEYDFLPPVVNEHNLSLYKYFTGNRKWQRTTEYHTSNKESWVDSNGSTEVWHTGAQSFMTDVYHPNNDKIRVGISLSGYPKFKVMNKMGGTATIVWTECESIEEATKLCSYLNGPDIQEVMSTFKWSGWNKIEVIKLLG